MILAADATETILVVEDEVLIGLAIADHLRDCGYRVLEAGTVDEAIAVMKDASAKDTPVDIVFSDVQMPGGKDGTVLAQWVRANFPRVRVILTSGGVEAADIAGELCADNPLIGKPYQPETVVRRIRRLLDGGRDVPAE